MPVHDWIIFPKKWHAENSWGFYRGDLEGHGPVQNTSVGSSREPNSSIILNLDGAVISCQEALTVTLEGVEFQIESASRSLRNKILQGTRIYERVDILAPKFRLDIPQRSNSHKRPASSGVHLEDLSSGFPDE